ncbi:MAG: M20 family metallopeptidase [Deltaproteobacteria bacterium]|nr:M20 family metallopeptidase [Deltaproteobacteria bacterium]
MTSQEAIDLVNRIADDGEIDQLLIDLLRAPSPQTSLQEADPALKKFIADFIAPRLQSLTGDAGVVDGMGNLLWQTPGAGRELGLLLMGYAMTFPAGGMKEPFSGAIVDGAPFGIAGNCAVGRGACEQKGALAAMMYTAALLSRAKLKLRGSLYLAVSLAGETGRHDAAKFILEDNSIRAQAGIVGLGTTNRICLGNKGRIDIEITVRGKSAHSSMPWDGVNAVDGARKVLERLDTIALGAKHAGLGGATLTVTQIKSAPEISHTVPDGCKIILDRRLLPGDDPDCAFGDIQNAVRDLAPWSIEVTRGAFMYPSEVSADCAAARSLRDCSQALSGTASGVFYSPAALDAGFLNRCGLETIMYGPGDLRFAHTDQEVVSLRELRQAARVMAAAALTMLV